MNEFDTFFLTTVVIPVLLPGMLLMIWLTKIFKSRIVRLILGNVVLLMFLVSVVFCIGETRYRFFYDSTDAFSLTMISQRWFKRHYKLNNFKSRDNVDYTHKAKPGKRRITFIGDSFTIGHGIEDPEDRFSNRIRQKNPTLDVHNMAANGMENRDSIQRLQ